jgi:hypothetical protein
LYPSRSELQLIQQRRETEVAEISLSPGATANGDPGLDGVAKDGRLWGSKDVSFTTGDIAQRHGICRVKGGSMSYKIMATCVLTLLAFVSSPLARAATTTCVVPSSGLVSWWTGDTDETDLYGVNNPTAVNAVTLVPGEVSNGFTFGTDGYIDIPPSRTLANRKFTWAAWVMPHGTGPNNDDVGSVIIEQGIDDSDVAVALHWRADPDDRFVFMFGNTGTEVIYSTDVFPPGVFYFVVGSYDGSTFRLYVNGVLEGTYTETKTIAYSSETWEIGSTSATDRGDGFPRTWNGIIDEVQAYRIALSASQIEAIYKAGSLGVCKAPVITNPAQETFAKETVGTTSPAKTVTIINNRNVVLDMNGFAFTGSDPDDFTESSTTCTTTLASRKSCRVSITFTPQSTGERSATLNVNDSDSGSPQAIALNGTGK